MTPDLRDEWNKHQSNFAAKWRRSMVARRKFCWVEPADSTELWQAIAATTESDKGIAAMSKDLHLLAAALATDHIVIACDEAVRQLFAVASRDVAELRSIAWVNPSQAEESAIAWLQQGAPIEEHGLGSGG